MSVYIDRTFLHRISAKLIKFTQKKDDLYNFRCPLCGDSQKNQNLRRGYVFRKKNDYFFRCHNCGASHNFYTFLERVEPAIIKEYAFEKYKDSVHYTPEQDDKEEIVKVAKTKPKFSNKIKLKSIDKLANTHVARQYCDSRLIPTESLSKLYYTSNFKEYADSLEYDKKNLPEDERLIIPFYNKSGKLVTVQGRSLGDSKIRYITLKLSEESEKYFGLDSVDENEMIYVVEGPIDSLFIKNSIATADSNLKRVEELYDKSKFTLIFDNEPRNKEIVKLMEYAVDNHYNIVIWPQMITKKDINDMILDNFTNEELYDIIQQNTFVNLRAKMELINWKRV